MKILFNKHFLFCSALVAPVLVHFALLGLYSVNAPRLDDFTEILMFLPEWHATTNTRERMVLLFRDYQNHRYILYHALLIVFDHVNFRTAAIIGNTPLVVLCALLMVITRHHPQKNIIWLITPLLVFNLQSWRAMFWAPLGTANLLFPAAALLACYFATHTRQCLAGAALASIFLTLSHGSGPLLFPVIGIYLGYRHGLRSRQFCSWLALSALVLILYFAISPFRSDAFYYSHPNNELLAYAFKKTGLLAQGFLAILGSHLLINDASTWQPTIAIALASAELLWLGWLIRNGALRTYPVLLLWLAFLLLVALSTASARVPYSGIMQALQGHYKLLNGILLWFVCVATLDKFTQTMKDQELRPTAYILAGSVTALYLVSLMLFINPARAEQQELLADAKQWIDSGRLQFSTTVMYVKYPNKKIKAAFDGGFYDPRE